MENVTQKISEFIAEKKYDQIQEDVLEVGKLHILDALGCMLAGSKEEAARIITRYIRGIGAHGDSTIIPLGYQTSPPYAALANGVIGHVLDYDDYDLPSMSMAHPSVIVLPAVLALGDLVAVFRLVVSVLRVADVSWRLPSGSVRTVSLATDSTI